MTTVTAQGMTEDQKAEFAAAIKPEIGREGAPTAPFRDGVTQLRINLWCDAIEDMNPVYTDPEFAAKSRFGGIVAPPTALMVWGMRAVRHAHTAPPVEGEEVQGSLVHDLLREAGYFGIVATNCEQEYVRYVRPGDVLYSTSSLDDVSDEKSTGIGRGFFITNKTTYYDQDGKPVGYHRFRTLHYLPGTGRAMPEGFAEPPALTADDLPSAIRPEVRLDTRRAADVEVGDQMDELVIPLTPLRIVSTALATSDFEDVHHDRDAANRKGMNDIFMNILTSNGFVGRFATDWAGPEAVIKSCGIRLGATNYPYDTMRLTGDVTAKEGQQVTLFIRGANRLGDHVVGTVVLELPS